MTDEATVLFPDDKYERPQPEQYRLTRFQVYNWGTFQDYHDIPIAQKGFLFLGPSGSGKTTLVDAISTMLNPNASVEYNTSARDERRHDRTLMSYVRGAWAARTDESTREIVTDYLRNGATWSALALTYKQSTPREWSKGVVTLLQLFWVQGHQNSKLSRHYCILNRDLDMDTITFGETRMDLKAFKRNIQDALHYKDYATYSQTFRSMLSIEDEKALSLLQKTQSMKNIESLELFLKNYMIDTPLTLATAANMVSEFVDLDTAHGIVVTASEQIKVLEEAKLHYEAYNDSGMKLYTAQSLKNDLNIHMLQREKKLVESEGRRLRTLKEERVAAARGAKEAFDDADKELRRLEDLRRTKGGDQIERLEEELKTLRKDAVRKSHDRDLVFGHCRNLGINLPHDADSFAAALDNAQRQLEVFGMEIKALKEDRDKLILEKDRTEGILRNNKRELESLKGRKNNIPAENIETRDSVLNDLYLKESDLPFVGELLEVLTDEARWRGAIERAYKDLALSVLVEDDLSPRIAEHVYSNNLAGRFSFIRKMPNNTDKLTPFDTNDRKYLSQKLEIKEGPHNLWLSRELRRAYDYLCAECLDEFHANENAITDTGLIKGRRTYHEKDDTEAISYRTNWVLGFDNLEKVGLYTQLVSDDSKRLTDINQNIERDDEDIQKKESLTEECKKLASFDFQRIDVASVEAAIESKTQLKLSLELDPELKNLGQAIEKQAKDRESASERYISAKSSVMTTDNDIKKIETRLNRVIQDSTGLIADYEAGLMLDKMISRICDELTLHNFYNTKEKLVKELNDDINKYTKLSEEAKSKTEFQFKHFKREWPKDASDQEADINSAQEFLSLLEKLKIEDLPRHRDNFVKQLTFQSRKYTTDLLAIFDQETKKIIKRVGIVNDSLKDVPFNCLDNKPTYLMIRVTKRHIPELDEFKEKIHDVSRHFLNNPKHMTEQRFAILKKIVGDLASQDRDKVLWRDTVIDVRNHLDFVGVEIDAEGNEVESYRSGSGKSGGQRQKLAATCLAAALRYQLGGRELGYPAYATVVFDEAFAKTDNEHTKLAMDIFTKMGFQMVMATPNKLIKVAEPYIGGAAYVYITNRNKSMITALQYDPERKALDLGEARGSLAPPEEDFAGSLAADSAAADRIAPGHIDDPASEDPAGGA